MNRSPLLCRRFWPRALLCVLVALLLLDHFVTPTWKAWRFRQDYIEAGELSNGFFERVEENFRIKSLGRARVLAFRHTPRERRSRVARVEPLTVADVVYGYRSLEFSEVSSSAGFKPRAVTALRFATYRANFTRSLANRLRAWRRPGP